MGADDGRPDPRLSAALTAYDASPAARAEVLASLVAARVFLAVEARRLDDRSGTDLSLIQLAGADGRRALPAFSDGHAVAGWRVGARPLPMPGPQACSTALAGECDVLLIDPVGPAVAVAAGELAELAEGRVPVPGSAVSIRRTELHARPSDTAALPKLVTAVAAALRDEPVSAARLLTGQDGPVLGVVLRHPLRAAELAALADRVARRLGPVLPPEGLDLAVVPEAGPGEAVPLSDRPRLSGR